MNVETEVLPREGRMPTIERLHGMVSAEYQELLRNDPVVRVTEDADPVHDMRVAVRRLRSVLRTARPLLDEAWVESLRDELDWLAGNLGAVRDLDVLTAHLQAEADTLPVGDAVRGEELIRPLEADRDDARERLLATMRSARYRELLDAVEQAAVAVPARPADISVEDLAAKEFRRLHKHARRLRSMNDAELHKLRIRGKRARYAAELAEPSRGKKARRFIVAAEEFQDVLGEHQDAVVAIRRLRDLAGLTERRRTLLVAGRLIEREERRKREARRAAPKAWRRLRRRGKRAW